MVVRQLWLGRVRDRRVDSEIHTTCADCGEPIDIKVRGSQPLDTLPVFHVLVPAVQWWDNIGFT